MIPKEFRDRLGWPEGSNLDVVQTANGVLFRMHSERPRLSVAEVTRRLREQVKYEGPPLPIERLSWSAEVDREFDERED